MRPASRSRPRRASLAVAALLAMATGCKGVTEAIPTANRYMAVNITGRHGGAGTVSAGATIILFEAFTASVPNSALQQAEQCVYSALDTSVVDVKGQKQAGASATLTVGTQALTLPYSTLLFRYGTAANAPFTYRAGDQATARIPGDSAVFPASSITVKLAEPLVPGPLTLPTAGQPLAVTWNGTNDASSAVLLSLRYANPPGGTAANEQVYCAARDDGAFDIPASGLAPFLAAPAATRSLKITRWRTNEAQPDPRTLVHIASSVDTILRFP